jgi:hypothetical protein
MPVCHRILPLSVYIYLTIRVFFPIILALSIFLNNHTCRQWMRIIDVMNHGSLLAQNSPPTVITMYANPWSWPSSCIPSGRQGSTFQKYLFVREVWSPPSHTISWSSTTTRLLYLYLSTPLVFVRFLIYRSSCLYRPTTVDWSHRVLLGACLLLQESYFTWQQRLRSDECVID